MRTRKAQMAYSLWRMAKTTKSKLSAFRFQLLAVLLLFTTLSLYHCTTAYAEWDPTHPDPILEYLYSYDQAGNITTITDQVKASNTTFTYDEVNRLTGAVGQYGANGAQETRTYSYDAVGNIQGVAIPVTYPADNGNIIDYNGKHIDYDYENRPIKITDTNNGTVTECKYDYSGQRVYKKVSLLAGGPVTKTFYVGNIYEETINADGSTTTVKYIYANSMRAASIVNNGIGSNTYYYLPDHLGSTTIMTNAIAEVVENISYEPWGGTVEFSSSTYNSPYKFTGQMLDDSTGLYYYGARYYDPILRRFITPDTVIQDYYNPQDLNRYSYAWNNPLRITDPTGHYENSQLRTKDYFWWNYNTLSLYNNQYLGLYARSIPKAVVTFIPRLIASTFEAIRSVFAPRDWVIKGETPGLDNAAALFKTGDPGLGIELLTTSAVDAAVYYYGGKLLGGGEGAGETGVEQKSLSVLRRTREGEEFVRFESGNPNFTKVTSEGGLKPGTFAAQKIAQSLKVDELNTNFNLPDPNIARTEMLIIKPNAGTWIEGPKPVMGGTNYEVIFPYGTGPRTVVGPLK